MRVVESRITDKFQITIPKDAREVLGVKQGDTLAFLIEEKTAQVVVKPSNVLDGMKKLVDKRFPNIREEVRKVRKEW